jgi:hypothetical protein
MQSHFSSCARRCACSMRQPAPPTPRLAFFSARPRLSLLQLRLGRWKEGSVIFNTHPGPSLQRQGPGRRKIVLMPLSTWRRLRLGPAPLCARLIYNPLLHRPAPLPAWGRHVRQPLTPRCRWGRGGGAGARWEFYIELTHSKPIFESPWRYSPGRGMQDIQRNEMHDADNIGLCSSSKFACNPTMPA